MQKEEEVHADAGPARSSALSDAAKRSEVRNIRSIVRAVKAGRSTKAGMIVMAIMKDLTDREVVDHVAVYDIETTLDSVRSYRRDLRKAFYAVKTNLEVMASRGRGAI